MEKSSKNNTAFDVFGGLRLVYTAPSHEAAGKDPIIPGHNQFSRREHSPREHPRTTEVAISNRCVSQSRPPGDRIGWPVKSTQRRVQHLHLVEWNCECALEEYLCTYLQDADIVK